MIFPYFSHRFSHEVPPSTWKNGPTRKRSSWGVVSRAASASVASRGASAGAWTSRQARSPGAEDFTQKTPGKTLGKPWKHMANNRKVWENIKYYNIMMKMVKCGTIRELKKKLIAGNVVEPNVDLNGKSWQNHSDITLFNIAGIPCFF